MSEPVEKPACPWTVVRNGIDLCLRVMAGHYVKRAHYHSWWPRLAEACGKDHKTLPTKTEARELLDFLVRQAALLSDKGKR